MVCTITDITSANYTNSDKAYTLSGIGYTTMISAKTEQGETHKVILQAAIDEQRMHWVELGGEIEIQTPTDGAATAIVPTPLTGYSALRIKPITGTWSMCINEFHDDRYRNF